MRCDEKSQRGCGAFISELRSRLALNGSLRVLANTGYAVAHETYKDGLRRRLPVNPILDFIPVRIALTDLVLRLADGSDDFLSIHTHDRASVLNGFLHFGRKRVYPLHGGG